MIIKLSFYLRKLTCFKLTKKDPPQNQKDTFQTFQLTALKITKTNKQLEKNMLKSLTNKINTQNIKIIKV